MGKFLRRASALLLAAAMLTLSACGGGTSAGNDGGATAAVTEAAVSDSSWDEISETEIAKRMGMGWNLGNQLEASISGIPDETAWGNAVITDKVFKTVKEAGFNTVRIPVSYLLKIGEAPDYTIDSAWLDRVEEVVKMALNEDLFVIMNIHGDGYYTVDKGWLLCVDENQEEIRDKFSKVWTQIAERFKDCDEHLIFESMNEVFDNTYGKPNLNGLNNINKYNEVFIEAVRSTGGNNAKRWVLMPGWNTNIDYTAGDYGFRIPDDPLCEADGKRIMVSVHFYDPYNFTLDENAKSAKTQWGKYATDPSKKDNWGQEDHVDKQMKAMHDKFVAQGYPVVIGEMGAQIKTHIDENNLEYIRYWTEYVVKAAKDNGCVPVYWDNGYSGEFGFRIINRSIGVVTQPTIVEAMMRAINSEGDYEIPAPDVK